MVYDNQAIPEKTMFPSLFQTKVKVIEALTI
jgi:hypothetical protein